MEIINSIFSKMAKKIRWVLTIEQLDNKFRFKKDRPKLNDRFLYDLLKKRNSQP